MSESKTNLLLNTALPLCLNKNHETERITYSTRGIKMRKKILCIGVLMLFLLPACGQKEEVIESPTSAEVDISKNTTSTSVKETVTSIETPVKEKEPDPDKEGEYILVSTSDDGKIQVWGNYVEDLLIVKEEDKTYNFEIMWGSPQMNPPGIAKADYNGDGKDEYCITTLTGTGTGVCIGDIYMITDLDSEPVIHCYDYWDSVAALKDRITAEYESVYGSLSICADGKEIGVFFINQILSDYQGAYVGIGYSEIYNYSIIDGKPFLCCSLGIETDAVSYLVYDKSIDITIPVSFENNEFSFGAICGNVMDNVAVPDLNANIPDSYVFKTYYADVTHNGINDKIELSVYDYGGDDKFEGFKSGVEAICLNVYEGYYDINAETEVSYTQYPIYTSQYATCHTGNGAMFLTFKNDKAYLLDCGFFVGQGEISQTYRVIVPEYGKYYILDEGHYDYTDGNKDDFYFDEFYESLNDWIDKDSILIIATDIDTEPMYFISDDENIINPRVYIDLVKSNR